MGQKNEGVTISGTEVSQHKSKESCWIAVRGKVYDVTGLFNLLLHCTFPVFLTLHQISWMNTLAVLA
jgi:hypothetical protein